MRILIICLIVLLCVAFVLCICTELSQASLPQLSIESFGTTESTDTDTMTTKQFTFNTNNYINIHAMDQHHNVLTMPSKPYTSASTFGYFVAENDNTPVFKDPTDVVEFLLDGVGSSVSPYFYIQAIPNEPWIAITEKNKTQLITNLTRRLQIQYVQNTPLQDITCCLVAPHPTESQCTNDGTNKDNTCQLPQITASWAKNKNILGANVSGGGDGGDGGGGWNQQNAYVTNQQAMQGANKWHKDSSYYMDSTPSEVWTNVNAYRHQCSSGCTIWVQIGTGPPVQLDENNLTGTRQQIMNNAEVAKSTKDQKGVTICCVRQGVGLGSLYDSSTTEMTCSPNVSCNTNFDTVPSSDESADGTEVGVNGDLPRTSGSSSSSSSTSNNSKYVNPNMNYSPFSQAVFGSVASPSHTNFWSAGSDKVQASPENVYGSTSSESQPVSDGAPLSAVGANIVSNPRPQESGGFFNVPSAQVTGNNQPNARPNMPNGAVVLPNQSGVFNPTDPSDVIYTNVRPSGSGSHSTLLNRLLQNPLRNPVDNQMQTHSYPYAPNAMRSTPEPDLVVQHVHVLGTNECTPTTLDS